MRKLLLTLIVAIFLTGCTCFYQPANIKADPQTKYYEHIRDWQIRDWQERDVSSVINFCLKYVVYTYDPPDHWQTYQEMINSDFHGDCEDIALFMAGTLRALGYPYQIRILLVKIIEGEHAMLKVELPNGKWRVYQTVDAPLWQIDVFVPICEFDEKEIYTF